MNTPLSRIFLAIVLAALVLAGSAGSAAAEVTATPGPQQQLATELALQASLSGELVVTAGWFEVTAAGVARLDTAAQETDLNGSVDAGLAETLGEFQFRGEVLGTINASRVLLAFEGDASSLGLTESASQAPPMSATAAGVAGGWDIGLAEASTAAVLDSRALGQRAPSTVADPGEQTASFSVPATDSATPLQLSPFRGLGISVFDAYWQLATLVLGLVVVGLLPRFSRRVADVGVSDPLRTAGIGLAVVLVVPVALAVFGLSLFGIPLAIAGMAVYLVLWWVGAVYGRYTVGVWLLEGVPRVLAAIDVDVGRIENRWAGLLVGTAAVGVFAVLPVVGPFVDSLVLLLGLGGLTRLAYRAYQRTERGDRPAPVDSVAADTDDA